MNQAHGSMELKVFPVKLQFEALQFDLIETLDLAWSKIFKVTQKFCLHFKNFLMYKT